MSHKHGSITTLPFPGITRSEYALGAERLFRQSALPRRKR